jgi:hypothetical protein
MRNTLKIIIIITRNISRGIWKRDNELELECLSRTDLEHIPYDALKLVHAMRFVTKHHVHVMHVRRHDFICSAGVPGPPNRRELVRLLEQLRINGKIGV